MTNKRKQVEEVDAVTSALSSGEQWVIKNRKSLIIVLAVAILAVAGYFIATNYINAQEEEAQVAMFKGEFYFERDSFEIALNGNGADYIGFAAIADEYSCTKSGNLATAYAGFCAFALGNNEEALEYLEAYDGDSDERLLNPSVIAKKGDCYANMGDYEKALDLFEEASKLASNSLLTPIFLKKAAIIAEKTGDYSKAISFYEEIKNKYESTMAGYDIDRYIERAKSQIK